MADFSKIALSGLKAANQQLAATSNNLANSETYGFKSQSVQFKALFAGSGLSASGIGTALDSTNTNFSNGSLLTTGDSLHHAIVGDGFFVVKDSDGGSKLSRVGLFEFNQDGVLVDNNGNYAQGYGTNGALSNIVLDETPLAPITSSLGSIIANLGLDDGTGSLTSNLTMYDALGTEIDLEIVFDNKVTNVSTGEASWDLTANVNGESISLGQIQFDSNGQIQANTAPFVDGVLNIDFDTNLLTPLNGISDVDIDMSLITGYSSDTVIRDQTMDGSALAEFDKYQVEDGGSIVTYYTDGRSVEIGKLALASVDNVDGLLMSGGYYTTSQKAGDINYGISGQSGFGTLTSGAVEGSNVDTTDELVNMISAQRFFQANSKVIGTSKELNSSLMQNT